MTGARTLNLWVGFWAGKSTSQNAHRDGLGNQHAVVAKQPTEDDVIDVNKTSAHKTDKTSLISCFQNHIKRWRLTLIWNSTIVRYPISLMRVVNLRFYADYSRFRTLKTRNLRIDEKMLSHGKRRKMSNFLLYFSHKVAWSALEWGFNVCCLYTLTHKTEKRRAACVVSEKILKPE